MSKQKYDKSNSKPAYRGRGKGKPNDTTKSGDYMKGDIATPDPTDDNNNRKVFNDLRWYVASEQILNDAARIPYNIPVGVPFARNGMWNYNNANFKPAAYDNAIPGIMVSCIMPMLGETEDGASAPVNIAANSLWQFVRSKISGTRTYLPVDMMIYMGAMDSLYCYVTWLTRLYATAYTYHQANRYLARAVVESQNVDFDDLVNNLTQFRAHINTSIAKVKALYLPSVLPIFLRHSWMFSHYFKEGDTYKDQIYFHTLAGIHRFTKDQQTGWGMLEAVNIYDTRQPLLTTAYLLQVLDSMIEPIYQDEDFNRIAGDMMKAYEGKVFNLTEIPDIAVVEFAYSEEVLLQFKNAKYKYIPGEDQVYYGFKNRFFDYYQLNQGILRWKGADANSKAALYNTIYCGTGINSDGYTGPNEANDYFRMYMGSNMLEWSKDTLLSSPHADVVAGENMINTRLSLSMEMHPDNSLDGYSLPVCSFGSEWPVCYYLVTYHKDKVTRTLTSFKLLYDRVLMLDGTDDAKVRSLLASQFPVRSAFKYLPELSVIEVVPESSTGYGDHIIYEPGRSLFEVDNYALVNHTIMDGMHRAAILGEYNIPDLSVKP